MGAVLLAATPSVAATQQAVVAYNSAIVLPSGEGRVLMTCKASTACKGYLFFLGDKDGLNGPDVLNRSYYAIPAKRTGWITVHIDPDGPLNPNNPSNPDRQLWDELGQVHGVTLKTQEVTPARRDFYTQNLTIEQWLASQTITGQIMTTSDAGPVSNMSVELHQVLPGGNTRMVQSDDVTPGGEYSFQVHMSANRSPYSYRLRIRGTDAQGNRKAWWYQGRDEFYVGGAKSMVDGSIFTPVRNSQFNGDFKYGSISGRVTGASGQSPANREVRAAGIPNGYIKNTERLREMDIPQCADFMATTTTDGSGNYRLDFLPTSASTQYGGDQDRRYVVDVAMDSVNHHGHTQRVVGAGNKVYASCNSAINYNNNSPAKNNLIKINQPTAHRNTAGGATGVTFPLSAPDATARAYIAYSGYSPLWVDSWVRVRERVQGVPILDSPVVAEDHFIEGRNRQGINDGYLHFKLDPGRYWLETGRYENCADWLKSVFPDNNAYFQGLDRGDERWKVVRRGTGGNSIAYAHGYGARSEQAHLDTDGQYRGRNWSHGSAQAWNYRSFCKGYSAGTIQEVNISQSSTVESYATPSRKGGTVYGRVTRSGGRTNKEIMVRVWNADGTTIPKYDVTDSSGRFYVAGVAPGYYSIGVNTDSWRGIGRDFSGRKTVRVTGSGNYNVGTLNFTG